MKKRTKRIIGGVAALGALAGAGLAAKYAIPRWRLSVQVGKRSIARGRIAVLWKKDPRVSGVSSHPAHVADMTRKAVRRNARKQAKHLGSKVRKFKFQKFKFQKFQTA